ncbi:MAG: branched-chain amino acid aminotransferase [Flavobacteriales bacterium]|jgi:branched-chain amino acid aminotransferase
MTTTKSPAEQISAHQDPTYPKACWLNGEIIPVSEARLSVLDHGVLYGDGVFEGMRFYNGRIFQLVKHLKRLRQSMHALELKHSYSDEELSLALEQCIAASGLESGYIRMVLTRGEGSLGLNPKLCKGFSLFILVAELQFVSEEKQQQGLSLTTVSTKRMVGSGIDTRIKSLNYLHSIAAKIEANHAGTDDGLLLNQHGLVAECSAANIFIVSNGRLITPPCSDGALEGITRAVVIGVAQSLGVQVSEQSLTPWDIYNSDECFITGSAARLLKIRSLDGRAIGKTKMPVFEQLWQGFMASIAHECS